MEKIINLLIKEFIEGVDTYTHNGSTWLIFTESKQWVIELTESKTLWYNYNFFKEIFEYTSTDVVENQHYITKWVEDNIINGVKHTYIGGGRTDIVEDTLQDGVKKIKMAYMKTDWSVEDTIENGVKETNHVDVMGFFNNKMEDTLQNGVKEIYECDWNVPTDLLEDVINDGVKETNHIKNNVRETKQFEEHLIGTIDEVIREGVKETKTPGNGDIVSTAEWMKENNSNSYPKMIDDVIENGVKEIRPSGCVDKKTGIFHYRIQEEVDDVVDNGEKVNGTFVGGKRQKEDIESVIGYGTKNPTD